MIRRHQNGTLNTLRGDGDAMGGRTGYVSNPNIGFVTSIFDGGIVDSGYGGGCEVFILSSLSAGWDGDTYTLTELDANGQYVSAFGGEAGNGYGQMIFDHEDYAYYGYYGSPFPSYSRSPFFDKTMAVADQYIITALETYDSGTSAWVWTIYRFDLDGTPDTTFGTAGVVPTDLAVNALAIRSDGEIVVHGTYSGNMGAELIFTMTDNVDLSGDVIDAGNYLVGAGYFVGLAITSDGDVVTAGAPDAGSGELFANSSQTGTSRVFVQQDANWNVTAILDPGGNVLERYLTDPYGHVTVEDAAFNAKAGGSDYNWTQGFQGKFLDAVSQTYNFNSRIYVLRLDRFGQLDPAQYIDGANRYQLETNNPINRVDATGMNEEIVGQVVVNRTNRPVIVYGDDPDFWEVVKPGESSTAYRDADFVFSDGRWYKVSPTYYRAAEYFVPETAKILLNFWKQCKWATHPFGPAPSNYIPQVARDKIEFEGKREYALRYTIEPIYPTDKDWVPNYTLTVPEAVVDTYLKAGGSRADLLSLSEYARTFPDPKSIPKGLPAPTAPASIPPFHSMIPNNIFSSTQPSVRGRGGRSSSLPNGPAPTAPASIPPFHSMIPNNIFSNTNASPVPPG